MADVVVTAADPAPVATPAEELSLLVAWGAVGAVVMMVGPALSARAVDAAPGQPAGSPAESAVVERLDAILAELRRQPAA